MSSHKQAHDLDARTRPWHKRPAVIVPLILAALLAVYVVAAFAVTAPSSQSRAKPHAKPVSAVTHPAQAGVPEIDCAAVVPGLLSATTSDVSGTATRYSIAGNTPVYGKDYDKAGAQPVGYLPAQDFSKQPTVVVGIKTAGAWTEVLTPARNATPAPGHPAAAQTMGWVKTADLSSPMPITAKILVSVSKQTVTVQQQGQADQQFPAGVGAPGTPTPSGVVGYVQGRYIDAAQGTGNQPINLTTLHSAVEATLFQGNVGGVLGVHYYPEHTGDISHGCIRLGADGITAVNELPLGALVEVTQ